MAEGGAYTSPSWVRRNPPPTLPPYHAAASATVLQAGNAEDVEKYSKRTVRSPECCAG